MPAHSIFNGSLNVGGKSIGVRLYSAIEDQAVHFHLLDRKTGHRVKQHMVEANTGSEVPSGEIRKGYETDNGDVVFLEKKDIDSVHPDPSDDIEVISFLPCEAILHNWYERPYYVGPDGDTKSYFALAEAMRREGREGLARWVMRQKEYFGALRERDGYLVLIALHYAEEVVSAKDLPRPAGRDPDPREINMAEQLIAALEGEFKPSDYKDVYRERVMNFIEQKANGQRPKLAAVPKKKATRSLLEALEASLRSTGARGGGKAVA
jgi:DNA end-binding protein Ku